MSNSIDGIWDAPAEVARNVRRSSSPDQASSSTHGIKRQRATQLFLDSDSDHDGVPISGAKINFPPRTPSRDAAPDIDYLFADLDDPSSGVADALGRRRPPLTPHEVLPSSSPPRADDTTAAKDRKAQEAEGKKRKPLPKLDEARLLGPDGFPALIAQTKGWKPKGKGHEVRSFQSMFLSKANVEPQASGFESLAPKLPILGTSAVSKNSVQGYRQNRRETLPFKADACKFLFSHILLEELTRTNLGGSQCLE
jgi:hypothetical protein